MIYGYETGMEHDAVKEMIDEPRQNLVQEQMAKSIPGNLVKSPAGYDILFAEKRKSGELWKFNNVIITTSGYRNCNCSVIGLPLVEPVTFT